MYYIVSFYKGFYITAEETHVRVKANTYENALRNARRKGYLLKDGWKWSTIKPTEN